MSLPVSLGVPSGVPSGVLLVHGWRLLGSCWQLNGLLPGHRQKRLGGGGGVGRARSRRLLAGLLGLVRRLRGRLRALLAVSAQAGSLSPSSAGGFCAPSGLVSSRRVVVSRRRVLGVVMSGRHSPCAYAPPFGVGQSLPAISPPVLPSPCPAAPPCRPQSLGALSPQPPPSPKSLPGR